MKSIKIDEQLKVKLPDFCLAALSFEMNVSASDETLKDYMIKLGDEVMSRLTLEQLLKEKRIAAARAGYKTLGKDPSRYRLATEALLRRLIKGNGLYYVNNAVDIGNILSVETNCSVAVLDEDKIEGDILIRIAGDEPYEGIGRGAINIENIPVYCDEIGPFGSPTSDTLRTSITHETKKVLVFILSFDKIDQLTEDAALAKDLFTQYGKATNFEISFVE